MTLRLRLEPILQRAANLVHLLRLAGAQRLGHLDRLVLGVAKTDHGVVGAGGLDDVADVLSASAELHHRLASHPSNAVFEIGHWIAESCVKNLSNTEVSSAARSFVCRHSICQRSITRPDA